jgi:hypothetical protein
MIEQEIVYTGRVDQESNILFKVSIVQHFDRDPGILKENLYKVYPNRFCVKTCFACQIVRKWFECPSLITPYSNPDLKVRSETRTPTSSSSRIMARGIHAIQRSVVKGSETQKFYGSCRDRRGARSGDGIDDGMPIVLLRLEGDVQNSCVDVRNMSL